MTKNISIAVLSILFIIFFVHGFIVKQENEALHETIDNVLPEMTKVSGEINDEYYKNFKKIMEQGCSNELIDSIWNSSFFLKNYENNLEKYKNTP